MCLACSIVLGVIVALVGLFVWMIWPADDSNENHWEADNP